MLHHKKITVIDGIILQYTPNTTISKYREAFNIQTELILECDFHAFINSASTAL
jgi:hypothetical protein